MVFVVYGFTRFTQIPPQVRENREIVLSAVIENVVLNVAITFIGVVVQIAQFLFRILVDAYVVVQLITIVAQGVADIHGQREADIAVCLCFLRQRHSVHGAQVVDEAVVAGNVGVRFFHECAERHHVLLELPELLSSLVASVGKVEDVLRLLRIEHQRVLVASVEHAEEVFANHLLLVFHESRLPFQLGMIFGQLRPKDGERVV